MKHKPRYLHLISHERPYSVIPHGERRLRLDIIGIVALAVLFVVLRMAGVL